MGVAAEKQIVVIGGGQAAGRAVAAMRDAGFEGTIALVGDEPHPPYERPPLSKGVLLGEQAADDTRVHGEDFYREQGIVLHLGTRADRIDRSDRRVELSTGETLAYDKLLLATGAKLRRLDVPGADLDGVCYLRSLGDCLEIQRRLAAETRVVVVGGGYIGLEVAAAARKRGCPVTVVELQPEVMARALAPDIGRAFLGYHLDAGVAFRLGVGVEGFAGGAAVAAVCCSDGSEVPADLVVVGVGVDPAADLAESAGLAVDDGIVTDEYCRTSDPDIYAAGDVTKHLNPILGRPIRLESWQNAQNQAIRAARNMCGEDEAYAEVPWFWSDQYDLNLQMVGLPDTSEQIVLRGSLEDRKFTALYLRDGVLVGANTVNNARDIRPCRELIARGAALDPKALADAARPLRDLLKDC